MVECQAIGSVVGDVRDNPKAEPRQRLSDECQMGPAPTVQPEPSTIAARDNLAIDYTEAGRLSEAIALHEATPKLSETKLSPDHPDTLLCRKNSPHRTRRWASGPRPKVSCGTCWPSPQGRQTRQPPPGQRSRFARREPAESGEMVGGRAAAPRMPQDPRESGPRRLVAVRRDEPVGWGAPESGRLRRSRALGRRGYEGIKALELRITVPERFRRLEAAVRVVPLYEEWGKAKKAHERKRKLGLADLPSYVFATP
jgi:hypothetical protein